MFFPSSKPAGVVCDGLTTLVVNSGVLVCSLVGYGLCYLVKSLHVSHIRCMLCVIHRAVKPLSFIKFLTLLDLLVFTPVFCT